ncbi:MAG: hypothetical protein GY816_14055 [Cytophagales bacterium]|nr:hypothetical protein [Cytophagales bacterium]
MKNFASLLLFLIGVSASAQIDLRYDLKKGQLFKVATIVEQNVEQNMMGTEVEVKQKFTMGISYEVTNASDGIFDMKCTYYRVAFESSAMGMEVNYNSENPPSTIPAAALGFAALIGKSFMMKFKATGEVVQITGFETMIEEMINGMELPDEERATTKELLNGQFGGEELTKTMEQSFKFFPSSGEANKGDKWSISTTLGMYAMDITNNYVLMDYDKRTATITVESEIEKSTFSQNTDGMEMEMSGSQTGQMIIDRKSGMLISAKINQDLTATANMMGMSVPMKIKSVNTFFRED